MSSDLETLARRAVACRHWRWVPGMLIQYRGPKTDLYPQGLALEARVRRINWISDDGDLPDLSDPATLGCLAALVREATGKPWLFAQFTLDDHWSICDLHDHRSAFVRSEAEAWVEVLEEAAP